MLIFPKNTLKAVKNRLFSSIFANLHTSNTSALAQSQGIFCQRSLLASSAKLQICGKFRWLYMNAMRWSICFLN